MTSCHDKEIRSLTPSGINVNNMAWVCVGYSGEELIFSNKPHRKICKNVFQIDDDDIIDRYWIDDKYCSYLNLPKGSIKKLIGRELTWDNEPVELK